MSGLKGGCMNNHVNPHIPSEEGCLLVFKEPESNTHTELFLFLDSF